MVGGITAVEGALVLDADRLLGLAQQQPVHALHPLHQRVVGVAHLVFPHAEAAARVDVVLLEVGDHLAQDRVALDRRRGVAVVGVEEPRVHDILPVRVADQPRVHQPSDGIVNDVFPVHRLELAVARFAEQRVVALVVRRHVRAVVAQVRHPVERAVALGEIHPALGARARLLDADADHVAAAVAEALRRALDVAGDFAVEDIVAQPVQRHGSDELVITDDLAVLEADLLAREVDKVDALVEGDVAVQGFADAAVELAGAAEQRELELVVGAPAEVVGAGDDVLDRPVDVDDGDALADPLLVHHLRRMGPDLEVVGLHEVAGDAVAEDGVDEFLKVLRGLVVALRLRLDQAGEALAGDFLREVADVVLERVGDPGVEHADPALAVVELVVRAHQIVEALVVVLVMAEHDVPADVPREAGGVGEAAGQAADVGQAVVDLEVAVAELLEAVAGAESRGAGADDDDPGFRRCHCNSSVRGSSRRRTHGRPSGPPLQVTIRVV